jgi:hypothetical protein
LAEDDPEADPDDPDDPEADPDDPEADPDDPDDPDEDDLDDELDREVSILMNGDVTVHKMYTVVIKITFEVLKIATVPELHISDCF